MGMRDKRRQAGEEEDDDEGRDCVTLAGVNILGSQVRCQATHLTVPPDPRACSTVTKTYKRHSAYAGSLGDALSRGCAEGVMDRRLKVSRLVTPALVQEVHACHWLVCAGPVREGSTSESAAGQGIAAAVKDVRQGHRHGDGGA